VKSRLLFVCLLVVASLLASGCEHVSPWQRGALASPLMDSDHDPVASGMNEHIWFSREAASGGRGVGGGGCGCN
jgi:hypothetical protein